MINNGGRCPTDNHKKSHQKLRYHGVEFGANNTAKKTPPKVEIIYQRQLYPQKTRRNENIFRGRQNYRQKYRHFQNSKFEIRMFANRITVA